MTKEAGLVVGALTRALLDGSRDLGTVPGLLVRIIDEELWRDRIDPTSGRRYEFRAWKEFVEKSGPDGLGSKIEQLAGICRGNQAALAALERAAPSHQGSRTDLDNNVNEVDRPEGNSAAQALRRLRTQRTDLHARVVAGELSPHAAMIEAGFREPTITISLDPQKAARTLARRFGPDGVAALIAALESQ